MKNGTAMDIIFIIACAISIVSCVVFSVEMSLFEIILLRTVVVFVVLYGFYSFFSNIAKK